MRGFNDMNADFLTYLLEVTQAQGCTEAETIQSLWSGYGTIARYALHGAERKTAVVKHIALNHANGHPRGWNTDVSHQRKIRSYQVETEWYQNWNHQCHDQCRTAAFLGAYSQEDEHWIILEDLDTTFPLRKQAVTLLEVKTCLEWLAHFHATFMQCQPNGLWEVGTYWHLATRPDEWQQMQHKELKQKAHLLDDMLNRCTYQTIVHGDAKLANFCFTQDGKGVAAVDFQYVGGGCGMKDVVYLLGSCLNSQQCYAHANGLLDHYFDTLQQALSAKGNQIPFAALEQEWRAMYAVAWTDFTRFLLGRMPTHQKVNAYSADLMVQVLATL